TPGPVLQSQPPEAMSSEPSSSSTMASNVTLESPASQIPNNSQTGDIRSSPLPSGAVIGLIIASIVISATVVVFLVRRRYVRRRIKLRKEWARSKSIKPLPRSDSEIPASMEARQVLPAASPFAYGSTTPPTTALQTSPHSMASRNSPSATTRITLQPFVIPPPPPAASYGMEYTHRLPDMRGSKPPGVTFVSANPNKKLLPQVYGPPAAILSKPVSAMVVSPFIPNLPDELDVIVGEIVQVISEFDDGWALCLSATQNQGMVPLECLDRGAGGNGRRTLGADILNRTVGGRAKRTSSLNVKLTRSGRF
ncbi:hypothetical protein BKA70DRAFT_1117247, partial [Coprinopsis sp. MPI-PUGE-AT-0042]